ncbi:MAG TPA: MaoC family dehydratase [Acidimicrobiales bacterium]|nr:MaoC family dehydratase [Acidimicrobiales bacterium]
MSPATVLVGVDGIIAAVGSHLGYSDWLEITQDRIDAFSEATAFHQWIHDASPAAMAGRFGQPIAQGDLTLSLSNYLLPQILDVQGISAGVNYGTGKVRFPSPVPVGARLRAGAELVAADPIPGGVQTTIRITIEVEGGDKPACVAEAISRYLA